MTHTLHITVLRREVIQENWVVEVDDEHYPADFDEALTLLDDVTNSKLVSRTDAITYQPDNREVIDMKAICSP